MCGISLLLTITLHCIEHLRIHVQTIHSGMMREYEMRNTDTVEDVKKRLQEEINIKASRLVLICGGVELRDNCLLFNCSAFGCHHTTLKLMLPMTGKYNIIC